MHQLGLVLVEAVGSNGQTSSPVIIIGIIVLAVLVAAINLWRHRR